MGNVHGNNHNLVILNLNTDSNINFEYQFEMPIKMEH